jgi:uncharacterized protein YabE (DUF348 family)/3D (Asp-Asp-Asp) domain-containing protein
MDQGDHVRLPGGPARFLKTHHLIAALVTTAVVVASTTGFVWAKKRVTVVVDGAAAHVSTQVSDVASLLREAGISVSDGDLVSPPPGTLVEDGDSIVVRHAVPVSIRVGDQRLELRVIGSTVADALMKAGMDPTAGTQTEPAIDTPLEPGMEIKATDLFLRVAQEEVEVPYDTVVMGDPSIPSGSRKVVTRGALGRALKVYQVLVTGGIEGARFLRTERMLASKIDEVVAVGTKRVFRQVMVSRGSARSKPAPPAPPIVGKAMTLEATAYTPWDAGCGGVKVIDGRKTRYGIPDGWGVVAVDPRVIPLGSKLFVEGYGYAVAADTGGVIHGNIIDVCYWGTDLNAPTKSSGATQRRAALAATDRWGRRTVRVTLLGR